MSNGSEASVANKPQRSGRLSSWQVWGAPLVLGVLCVLGLTTALVSDAAGDIVAWLSLSIPVIVVGWYSRQS